MLFATPIPSSDQFGDRPAACIAAESDAERVEDALEWYEFSKVGPSDTEKRDRVADALAAVLCTTKDQQ